MTSTSAGMAILVVALGFALLVPTAGGKAWTLVTPEEDARDNAAPHVAALLPESHSGPTIRVLQPDISRRLTNPMTIELQFAPGPSSAIDMRTFNATYGWLGLNITGRLLQHSVRTANGLIARDIELPPGDHRVTMSIADTSGRSSSQTFNLSVSR